MQFICGEFDVSAYEAAVRGGGWIESICNEIGGVSKTRNRFFIEERKEKGG